uniref:Uncharacterized protein n=1 Tax=Panagrolaimus sp. JU765 TaxID=591449 RepID=A0AC34RNY4_9BILA
MDFGDSGNYFHYYSTLGADDLDDDFLRQFGGNGADYYLDPETEKMLDDLTGKNGAYDNLPSFGLDQTQITGIGETGQMIGMKDTNYSQWIPESTPRIDPPQLFPPITDLGPTQPTQTAHPQLPKQQIQVPNNNPPPKFVPIVSTIVPRVQKRQPPPRKIISTRNRVTWPIRYPKTQRRYCPNPMESQKLPTNSTAVNVKCAIPANSAEESMPCSSRTKFVQSLPDPIPAPSEKTVESLNCRESTNQNTNFTVTELMGETERFSECGVINFMIPEKKEPQIPSKALTETSTKEATVEEANAKIDEHLRFFAEKERQEKKQTVAKENKNNQEPPMKKIKTEAIIEPKTMVTIPKTEEKIVPKATGK